MKKQIIQANYLLHGIFSSHSLALHILKPTTFVRVQNLKNMITVVVIRTPKGDKKCKRSCQSKNPRKAHSSFWSREFSGVNDLFVVGSNMKTPKAPTKTMKVREMKIP